LAGKQFFKYNEYENDANEDANGDEDDADTFTVHVPLLVRHVFTFNHFKAIFQLRCAAHSLS
jgi:hypothetical protein